MYIQTSAPIGAWEVKLEIMTDRPTHRPTDRHTDMRGYREVSLPVRYSKKHQFNTKKWCHNYLS